MALFFKNPNIPVLVYYHGRCMDGEGAAWVMRNYFESKSSTNVKFIPYIHHEEFSQPPSNDVVLLFLDCSPPLSLNFVDYLQVVVVDHHYTFFSQYKDRAAGLNILKVDVENFDIEAKDFRTALGRNFENTNFFYSLKYSPAILNLASYISTIGCDGCACGFGAQHGHSCLDSNNYELALESAVEQKGTVELVAKRLFEAKIAADETPGSKRACEQDPLWPAKKASGNFVHKAYTELAEKNFKFVYFYSPNSSGCVLAVDFVNLHHQGVSGADVGNIQFEAMTWQWFLFYTQDRDLWEHKLENTKVINNFLYRNNLYKNSEFTKAMCTSGDLPQDIKDLERAPDVPFTLVNPFNVSNFEVGFKNPDSGSFIGVFNVCTYKTTTREEYAKRSDIASYMLGKVDSDGKRINGMAVIYHEAETYNPLLSENGAELKYKKAKYWVSLRTTKETGINVAKIAEENGGGGHFCAAGFSVNSTTIYAPKSLKTPIPLKAGNSFIVVEGVDKSGKTTLCKNISERFDAEYCKLPDRSTPIGQVIDQVLQKKIEMDPTCLKLLFQANRLEVLGEKGKYGSLYYGPARRTIIMDRYYFSGICYGLVNGGENYENMDRTQYTMLMDEEHLMALPMPKCVIYMEPIGDDSMVQHEEVFETKSFLNKVDDCFKKFFKEMQHPYGPQYITLGSSGMSIPFFVSPPCSSADERMEKLLAQLTDFYTNLPKKH